MVASMASNGDPRGLSVEHVSIAYRQEAEGRSHFVTAVEDATFSVPAGRALGILGETGSGKSSLGLAVMRLLPSTARLSGTITLGDVDVTALSPRGLARMRGRDIGMIFQDPSSALNPVRTIGAQIEATARAHFPGMSREQARELAGDRLEALGVKRERLANYPHQLSGGMQQRALIAMVMITNPRFIVADEPTASLDKVTERQIVRLLQRLQAEQQLGFLLISHDIGVVADLCDEVVVIFRGRIVEQGPTEQVLSHPDHPYTQTLVRAARREVDARGRLVTDGSFSRRS